MMNYLTTEKKSDRHKVTCVTHVYTHVHTHTHLSGVRADRDTTCVQYSLQLFLAVILDLVQFQLSIMNESNQNRWIS